MKICFLQITIQKMVSYPQLAKANFCNYFYQLFTEIFISKICILKFYKNILKLINCKCLWNTNIFLENTDFLKSYPQVIHSYWKKYDNFVKNNFLFNIKTVDKLMSFHNFFVFYVLLKSLISQYLKLLIFVKTFHFF